MAAVDETQTRSEFASLASKAKTMQKRLTTDAAEALATRALGFLAAEPERLEPFLAATGLGPSTLRAAAREPGFLAAVLDHIAGNDSLLLEFAGNLSLNPEIIAQARSVLAGPPAGDVL